MTDHTPKLHIAIVLATAAGLVAYALHEWWTTDDALITFRYVQNFASGHGLVYNPGERVEGFSSFLFVLFLAPFQLLHLDLFVVANLLGIAASVVELILVLAIVRRVTRSPALVGLAGVLFASDRIVTVWSTGGLETSVQGALVTALIAVVLLRPAVSGAIAAGALCLALAVNRPEGALYFPLYLAWLVLARRAQAGPALARAANVFLPGVALLLVARFLYYNELLANPFRAKVAGVSTADLGAGYLHYFAMRVGWTSIPALAWVAVAGVAIWGVVRRDRAISATTADAPVGPAIALAVVVVVVVAQLAAVFVMGGDYMCDFRFCRPIIGPLVLAVACAFALAPRNAVVVVVAFAFVAAHGWRQYLGVGVFSDAPPAPAHKQRLAVSRDMADEYHDALLVFAEPSDTQLVDKSGFMGFGHRMRTIDATGLLSREIERDFYPREDFMENGARQRFPGHQRWPRVEFMQRERFTFIFAKVNDQPPARPEINPDAPRRTREYPFLHVTISLRTGRYLRFFTTLTDDEVFARARTKGLTACVRAPWREARCVNAP